MYDISDNELNEFLATIKAKDPRTAFLTNQVNDFNAPKNFSSMNDINPENIPEGMVYGEVEYYNSTQGILYENVEAHRDQGWEDVYIYNHPELTQLSREAREKKNRSANRHRSNDYYDFDPDDVLIKRKGVMMMQKDAAEQRRYEFDLHSVSRVHKHKTTEEGFNSDRNEFGMRLKIDQDTQETLPGDNLYSAGSSSQKLYDYKV